MPRQLQAVDDDMQRGLVMFEEMEQPEFGTPIDERPVTSTIQTNGPMNDKLNPHKGSDFDGFLKREGIYQEVMTSPKVKKAITELADSIKAGQHEAFAAGWNAFLATHSGLLIAHGVKDFRLGFERAWTKYWEKRKELNSGLSTDRAAKKLSTLPQGRGLRGSVL
jgi:hypothetical protein